jgi:hypothetical protein
VNRRVILSTKISPGSNLNIEPDKDYRVMLPIIAEKKAAELGFGNQLISNSNALGVS